MGDTTNPVYHYVHGLGSTVFYILNKHKEKKNTLVTYSL